MAIQDAYEDPDSPWSRCVGGPEPSPELLDRAHAGWERFISSVPEPSDD